MNPSRLQDPPGQRVRSRAGVGLGPALALVAVTALLAGCGAGGGAGGGAGAGGTDGSAGGAAATGTGIVISDFAYSVPEAVPAGTEVTVTNRDGVGHTVTADEGAFDVAVGPGETVVFTAPDEAGVYDVHCIPHPSMTASLVVS